MGKIHKDIQHCEASGGLEQKEAISSPGAERQEGEILFL